MRQSCFLLLIGMVASAGCFSADRSALNGESMSIIALPVKLGSTTIGQYVSLRLPYGIIISNADTNSAPSYYLFSNKQRTILKTHDVGVFLAEIEKLPDGVVIDMVSKCTVPFHTQHGVNIDEQYQKISSLLLQKRFTLVSSLDDHEKHVSFCYCETGFTILEKPRESEHAPSGDAPKAAPKK